MSHEDSFLFSEGSSGSDMEDIVEDTELISPLRPLSSSFRRANSEPTLSCSHKRRSPSVLKIPTTISHVSRSNTGLCTISSRRRCGFPETPKRNDSNPFTRDPVSYQHKCFLFQSLSDKLNTVFSIAVEGRCVPKAYSFDGVNPNLPVPFKVSTNRLARI